MGPIVTITAHKDEFKFWPSPDWKQQFPSVVTHLCPVNLKEPNAYETRVDLTNKLIKQIVIICSRWDWRRGKIKILAITIFVYSCLSMQSFCSCRDNRLFLTLCLFNIVLSAPCWPERASSLMASSWPAWRRTRTSLTAAALGASGPASLPRVAPAMWLTKTFGSRYECKML